MDEFFVKRADSPIGGQFAWVDKAVVQVYGKEIGVYGVAMYTAIASYIHNGRPTFVKLETIAKHLDISIRMAQNVIAELIRLNLIAKRSGKLEGRLNEYILLDVATAREGYAHDDKSIPETPSYRGGGRQITTENLDEVGKSRRGNGGEVGKSRHPNIEEENKYKKKTNTAPRKAQRGDNNPSPEVIPPGKHLSIWTLIVDAIDVAYREANPDIPVPWSKRAFSALQRALASFPSWGADEWMKCIANRYASDAIIKGDPPESFIPQLKSYISGPKNQYGRAKESSSGTYGNNNVSARTQRNRDAVEQVLSEIDNGTFDRDAF
jgi:hypothetical protein